ncbi:MAG: YacL family protein [Pseudanabaena sp.]|jgi:uncharacterized protein YacL (UPF0231 family)
MIKIRFYQDPEGYFKTDTDLQHTLLGQYFETEIQGIPEVCQEVLDDIKVVEQGDRPLIEGIGNAYGLKITAQTATIWSEFTEMELTLEIPLPAFKQALEDCLKACGAN